MSKIRVLSDHLANQIAAGEVVERPASVAKELVENSIDAGARRVAVEVEAGGRKLLRVADDGEGMTRDDAVLAFERHATSKISTGDDLARISTLGFRGEALASIASVARVELVTQTADEAEGTRVLVEGGRMRDVQPAAHPRGTTVTMRDLFFNVPARRKFLRSEATESFHLTNLVTHYALAHPEIEFRLTNNGREALAAAPAESLRERAYQIFGADFLDSLLEVAGGHAQVARVGGYVSAPRERRTTRDAQYLFVNGRFVRDRLVSRALTEGYRTVLPHGVYPAALLFLEVPLEEVDVNVHPAKTEVRFRRAAAVADAVREAVRAALAAGGYLRSSEASPASGFAAPDDNGYERDAQTEGHWAYDEGRASETSHAPDADAGREAEQHAAPRQEAIEFAFTPPGEDAWHAPQDSRDEFAAPHAPTGEAPFATHTEAAQEYSPDSNSYEAASPQAWRATVREDEAATEGEHRVGAEAAARQVSEPVRAASTGPRPSVTASTNAPRAGAALPPINSIAGAVREIEVEQVSRDIRPLYQLEESYIVAVDAEGLLLFDQHAVHERILFDKYRRLEAERAPESQQLLVPETFDLTPAQAAAFDHVADELEAYGFGLMRLSGRTVALKAVPADLPPAEARNMFAEVLDTVDAERRGAARETLRERVAASLACRAAVKVNMPLAEEKMRWLIDRLLVTSSPTTCPHGRPAILRLTTRDIERGFHRP